jgi:hypothetical protein
LTPRKRKLYEHIRNKGSELCKLKKKYKEKLKEFCDVNSDPSTGGESFIFFEFRGCQIFGRNYYEWNRGGI